MNPWWEQHPKSIEFAVGSLQDVQGLANGVCAGCGGVGAGLLKDSIGLWCEDCGGIGIAVQRG